MKFLVIALFPLVLSACASPRYQSVKRYEPPAGAQACLSECDGRAHACRSVCQARYQQCVQDTGPEVRARYEQAIAQYEAALAAYRWELDRYRMDLMLGWGYGYGHPDWGAWGWFPMYPPPRPPRPPNPDREAAAVIAARCDRDCGCEATYDGCFLACGGRIVHETVCVAHCPSGE